MLYDKRKSYKSVVTKNSMLDLTSPQGKKQVKFTDSRLKHKPSESGGGNGHTTSPKRSNDSKSFQLDNHSKKSSILKTRAN